MKKKWFTYGILSFLFWSLCFATCRLSTKDVSPIPAEIKTFRVEYLGNKARYVNPQLSPKLTEALRKKVMGQTRLRMVNDNSADYDIGGYVTQYNVSTSGVTNQKAGTNRLNVTFHLVFKNTQDAKKNFEADLTSNYDFSASLSLQAAENDLNDKILENVTEAIFNRIFSNW